MSKDIRAKGYFMRVKLITIALVTVLSTSSSCYSSEKEQGSGDREETLFEQPVTSGPAPAPSQKQQSTQGAQTPPERYEGLQVGEPAEFENGLIVTLEGASLIQIPVLSPQLVTEEDRLVVVRFSVENASPTEGQVPRQSFNITTALWQALDSNGYPLQKIYPVETTLEVGELPNPSPEYPYVGWQGLLEVGQKQQGSVLFVAPLSEKRMRARFTQPVMAPPVGEWELGAVSGLPQEP